MLFSDSRRRYALSTARRRVALVLCALVAALSGLLFLVGCSGSGGEKETVLAKVGTREITADYYEQKLAKMTEEDLPKDDAREPVDTSTPEGKQAFLKVLINKDLCYLQGERLGYLKDPQIAGARGAMIDYEATLKLWASAVGEPSRFISDEEAEAFYERWGETRTCEYLMTNFEQDALDAREAVLSGLPWSEAVKVYHDGAASQGGRYEIALSYGQYSPEFEAGVFSPAEGEVSMPIKTPNGYWLVRVAKVDRRPKKGLDQERGKIIELLYNRKKFGLQEGFKQELRDGAKLTFHEEALRKAWEGLPAEEPMFKPGTQDPVPRESLNPLDVKPQDMDLPFYSYEVYGELREASLGDYKGHFDRMNVFQRPKKHSLVGGLRNSITQELTQVFLKEEAERRGLNEAPEVVAKVDEKIEQMIVSKIFRDIVKFDERVSPEDLEAFWEQYKDEFKLPEGRRGYVVKTKDRGKAEAAVEDARQGVEWARILDLYGVDRKNMERGGVIELTYETTLNPVTLTLFDLPEPGQVSEPVNLAEGLLAVVKLEEIVPPRAQELDEVRETAAQVIKAQRKDEAFNALLDEWAADFGVEIYEDKLLETPSWEDLQAQAAESADLEPVKEKE